MNKSKLFNVIEMLVPLELQESWDNCGLQIDNKKDQIDSILLTLEVNDLIIDEAIEKNVDFILSHHPLFFSPIKSLTFDRIPSRFALRLIEAGIGLYSCHTNFDITKGGTNDYFARVLGLSVSGSFPEDVNICRYADLHSPITGKYCFDALRDYDYFHGDMLRFVGNPDVEISRIGWCTGAGTDFIDDAIEHGCQLFITGDVKYHQGQDAISKGIAILDVGHYGSEKLFGNAMESMLKDRKDELVNLNIISDDDEYPTIIKSVIDINPFKMI